MKEFFERLKVCWCVLTHRNYAFFSCKDSAIKFNVAGHYQGLNDNGLAAYSSFSNMWFYTYTGKRTLENILWNTINDFSVKMIATTEMCDE